MSRLTNRLERVERAARSLDPTSSAWRVCCSQPGETNDQATDRHRAHYGRGPVVIVPARFAMNPIERRLQKIEAAVMPKPSEPIIVLVEPPGHAAAVDLASYAEELAAAKASGIRTVVVREDANRSGCLQDPNGIEYVPTLAHAGLIVASTMPSERGKASLLDDVLQDCSGTGLQPVKLLVK